MDSNTIVLFDVYKGFPTFGIWKVDANGEKVGRTPIVSFGLVKAKAILKHIDDIQNWVDSQNKQNNRQNPSAQIDLTAIKPEQLQQLLALLNK